MRANGSFWRRPPAALPPLAKSGPAEVMSGGLVCPAGGQFWGQWESRPQRQQPPQRQQQQEFNPFGGWFGNQRGDRPRREQRERDAPPDYSRAPNTARKADTAPTTPIVVMGDGMADWLAYGL